MSLEKAKADILAMVKKQKQIWNRRDFWIM